MIVDMKDISSAAIYKMMISVIVPRPIAFISSVSASGRLNVAPFSFFTGICSVPPLLGVAINTRAGVPKDTLANIRSVGDFVVNVVNEELAERMVHSSGDWPEDVSEFELTGLTPVDSDHVTAPRVGESPVSLECRLHREIELGTTFFVVGEIVRVHMADDVLTDGRVDVEKLRPLGRLGGSGYSVVRNPIELRRPKVDP